MKQRLVDAWKRAPMGGKLEGIFGFGHRKLHPGKPSWTQPSSDRLYHWSEPRGLSALESIRIQTFPDDYDFLDNDPVYVCGMSVPPRMMERVAGQVARQLLGAPMHAPGVGPWIKSDLDRIPKNGLKVFSCFHCGGGSSFGYKLAGFEVVGGVEIDPKMMALYRANHRPRHSYQMGVQEFARLDASSLPRELLSLDVLDGSPPCSSFSMVGSREKAWGTAKRFREGQAHQVLDDLFFDFIAVAAKLRPRVVVAENVKGMLHGNARGYVKEIFAAFKAAGYTAQLFLLNASRMGVPQARERVFFVASRDGGRRVSLSFDEPPISVSQAFAGIGPQTGKAMSAEGARHWAATPMGGLFNPSGRPHLSHRRLHPDRPSGTQTATSSLYHWMEPRHLSRMEAIRIQSFPDDYNFVGNDPVYVCGMSVPPRMMERVARQVARQALA